MHGAQSIIKAIDESPLNRGLEGAAWLASPGNIPIVSGDDIALFDDEGDDIYQVHFLYSSTGKKAVAAGKEAFRTMFEAHNAELIFGLVPAALRYASFHARFVGGKFVGVRETPFGPCELYVLSKDMWKGRTVCRS